MLNLNLAGNLTTSQGMGKGKTKFCSLQHFSSPSQKLLLYFVRITSPTISSRVSISFLHRLTWGHWGEIVLPLSNSNLPRPGLFSCTETFNFGKKTIWRVSSSAAEGPLCAGCSSFFLASAKRVCNSD